MQTLALLTIGIFLGVAVIMGTIYVSKRIEHERHNSRIKTNNGTLTKSVIENMNDQLISLGNRVEQLNDENDILCGDKASLLFDLEKEEKEIVKLKKEILELNSKIIYFEEQLGEKKTIDELVLEQEKFNKEWEKKENIVFESLSKDLESHKRQIEIECRNKVEDISLKTISNGSSSYFYTEGFITSGPRKESDKRDALGEDTCGFCSIGNKLLFWVLDGTSSQDIVYDKSEKELFSSRLLAQQIANKIPDIYSKNKTILSEEILELAIQATLNEWSEILCNIEDFSEIKIPAKFGTTIILGVLDLDGKIEASRIGDSSLTLFNSSGEFVKPSFYGRQEEKDNQFFVIAKDDSGSLVIKKNNAKIETITVNDIGFLLCFSDGVNSSIPKNISKNKLYNLKSLREQIYRMPQNSEDDKSLVLAKIMK